MKAADGRASDTVAKKEKRRTRATSRRRASYRSPRVTVNTSLPVFLFVGVLFACVGFVVLYIFRNSEEVVIDYTHCTSVTNASQPCNEVVGKSNSKCWCEVPFRIENEMKDPVFLFYGLIVLVKRSQPRLPGAAGHVQKRLDGDGDTRDSGRAERPLPVDGALPTDDERTRGYRNVGAAAGATSKADSYSVLTDTLTVFSVDHSMYVRLNRTGAAWPDMRCGKCGRHFPTRGRKTRPNLSGSAEPRNENVVVADAGLLRFENDHFTVWMQPVASSTFEKLYRKTTNPSTRFNGSLLKGSYRLLVTYTYPVTFYGGGKSLIVANSAVLGAKNRLLGVAFVATGCVCLIMSTIICAIRSRKKNIVDKKTA